MKTYLFLILVVTSATFLMGCEPSEPPLKPLSQAELTTLNMFKQEYENAKRQKDAYMKEVERINKVSQAYLDEYILLDNFSLYKTNRFNDKRERLCYKGDIENAGNEIVERLALRVVLRDSKGERIAEWEPALVSANDVLIDKDPLSAATQLAITASGKKLPLGPGETMSLTNNRNCMKAVYSDWEVKDITYEVNDFRLRTAIPEPDSLALVRISVKIHELRSRAEHNNQLNKN
jgi:hypothetical protein